MMRRLPCLAALSLLLDVSSGHAQNITKADVLCPAGLRVNSYTGNLHHHRTDLAIPARGLSLAFTFSYNSGSGANDFGYGDGWTHSFNLLYQLIGADIVIRREDGRKDRFTWNGSGYVAPVGVFDDLVEYQPGKLRL